MWHGWGWAAFATARERCAAGTECGELWGCPCQGLLPPMACALPQQKPGQSGLPWGQPWLSAVPWNDNFASCSLWRELLPISVSVKCNPEVSWDNHGKVSFRNAAFHYWYSENLQVWTLWILLSPFCSFVSVPCKVQLIVVKEQIYFALKKVFCFSWKEPKSHGKAKRMVLNSYSQIQRHSPMAHGRNILRAPWWNCWQGCQGVVVGLGGTWSLNRANCQT